MSINPPNRNQPRIVRSHGRTDGNLALSKDPEAPAIKRSIREVRDARVIGLWPANTHSGRNCPSACVARNGRDRGGEVSKPVYGA
jgi:hypothetical protein